MKTISEQCQLSRSAYQADGILGMDVKNKALALMSEGILNNIEMILSENAADLEAGKQNGIATALLDRLALSEDRLKDIAAGILSIRDLDDPVGDVLDDWTVEKSGLHVRKVRVPIGVIGMIYEARPNVTADAIALTLKTGNAVVLRGSSSAYRSNFAIASVLKAAIAEAGANAERVQLLEDTTRDGVETFVRMNGALDLIIPRGGAALIQRVVQTATVPTIETGVGNCHVYVDKSADLAMAVDIAYNAKTHRPSVCNACESLLVHADIADEFLKALYPKLMDAEVLVKGDAAVREILPDVVAANESDWDTEFLNMTLPIKVVASLDDAMAHIQRHGSHHTEVIVAKDAGAIERFTTEVDAAAVGANVSTRFTDGGEFGFGAEIGISTQMLHARGPMGLAEMTSYKYIMDAGSALGIVRK